MKYKISEILKYLDDNGVEYNYIGNRDEIIKGFSSLSNYKNCSLTWVKTIANWDESLEKKVTLCVVQEGISINAKNQIICSNSKKLFFDLIENLFSNTTIEESIGLNTIIGPNVKLGQNVQIGSNCSIKGNIYIGDNTVISDNVVIKNDVIIGANSMIQAFVVIGEDGYGYSEDDNHKKKMVKHYGGVVIGENVFIGAHTNIARGTIDDTIIGNGVKIAPSTHIGHNNKIGDNSAIICSQIYGSVQSEENVYVVGSIVKNQCKIGKDSMVGMGTIVTKDIEPNKVVVGIPGKVIRDRYS